MSLIYSYINYCNLIWGSAYNSVLKPLHILLKKAVRIINGSHYLDSTEPIFQSLELLNIYQVFKLNCLQFAYKCLKDDKFPQFKMKIIKNSTVHNYETRINDLYRPPPERLEMCQKSFLYQSVKLWNLIEEGVRKYNALIIFKNKVKALLIDNKI